ncbi:MAG: LLM class F420-dependent oxidoreductase [Actinobacteria bacterium]|nr:LLM class F420-dependent oxidoreductase [Actinomycetota bacterium]
MRYGIVTPVILLNPRVVNPWEHEAGIDELETVARAVDRLGYHHLTASNHIAIPHAAGERRGRRYWDPAVTLGYVAAITERVRLATFCLVLGYHHPLEIVKRYGTLDRASRGRVILGLGVGSLEEEFEMLGRPFDGRGERGDDAIRAIQAAWGAREPRYHGPHWSFEDVTVDPTPVQDKVPIWIGGRTARSLRRALEFGAGWAPFGLEPEAVRDLLARHGRPDDVGLAPEPPLDPTGDPDGARRVIDHHLDCGATILNLRFRSDSLDHWLDQAEAFAALAGPSD